MTRMIDENYHRLRAFGHSPISAAFTACDIENRRIAALAAGSRRAKTPKAVECEASQSGHEVASPKDCRWHQQSSSPS